MADPIGWTAHPCDRPIEPAPDRKGCQPVWAIRSEEPDDRMADPIGWPTRSDGRLSIKTLGGQAMQTLSIACQKGGTGKTTVAVNIAVGLAKQGKRVLVLDADPQGNASALLSPLPVDCQAGTAELVLGRAALADCCHGSQHDPNLSLIPATRTLADAAVLLAGELGRDLRIRNALADAVDGFDFVIIDCPPGRDLLTLNSMAASDWFILVTDPSPFGASGLQGMIDLADGARRFLPRPDRPTAPRLAGVVLNRVQRGNIHAQAVESIRAAFGSQLLGVLPHAIAVDAAHWQQKPILLHEPDSLVSVGLRTIIQKLPGILAPEGSNHERAA